MIAETAATGALFDELLAVLDQEIDLLRRRDAQLAGMSAAICQRDEERLEALLEDLERSQQRQAAADENLKALLTSLGQAVHCPTEHLKLAALAAALPDQQRLALDCRRQEIILLTEKVCQKQLETMMVLSECARINRLLLSALFPDSEATMTYGVGGPEVWRPDTGLVDAEL